MKSFVINTKSKKKKFYHHERIFLCLRNKRHKTKKKHFSIEKNQLFIHVCERIFRWAYINAKQRDYFCEKKIGLLEYKVLSINSTKEKKNIYKSERQAWNRSAIIKRE